MSVSESYQRFSKIAETLGFALDIVPTPGSMRNTFRLSHPASNSILAINEDTEKQLLEFLNTCRFATGDQAIGKKIESLNQKVLALEQQLNGSAKVKSDTQLADADNRSLCHAKEELLKTGLQLTPDIVDRFCELYLRAEAIGCHLFCSPKYTTYNLKGRRSMRQFNCIYVRPYIIRSSRGHSVALKVGNAYDDETPHNRLGREKVFQWFFQLPENLELLELFIKNDEEFYQL